MKKITITFSREQLQELFRILSVTDTSLITDKRVSVLIAYFKKKLMIRFVKYLADENRKEVKLKLEPAELVALQIVTDEIDLTQAYEYIFPIVYKINEVAGSVV